MPRGPFAPRPPVSGGSSWRAAPAPPGLPRAPGPPRPPGRPWAAASRGVTPLELLAVEGLPEVRPGDDLGDLISSKAALKAADVLVVAQKVVSKSEGKLRNLATVEASDEAKRIAAQLINLPDPRLVQVVLDER